MMIRHGYPTFWRIGLIALLALFITACGGGGGSDNDNEQPAPPAAELTASFTQQVSGLDVSVDASASTGDIASYRWDFGDGATGVGKISSHSYMAAGTYSVTLTLTDDKGATASQSASVSVVAPNVAPTAAFSHTAKELVASFDASASSDSDGSIASYSWNFGDGATGSGKTSSHSYVRTGAYIVTLTVTDDKGVTANQSASVIVVAANVAPTAAFTHSETDLVAIFDASSSSDSDGSIVSYSWNFGDGTTGSGKSASHSYAATGTYSVTLTVTDDKGTTASLTQSVLLNSAEGIHFPDPVLESEIRQTLRHQDADFTDTSPITAALLETITWLYVNHNDGDEYIQSLDGADKLVNLEHLSLYGQHITSIAPLSNLTKLKKLDLRNNMVRDISPLVNAKKLESLYLDANPVYNLQGLENLSSLNYLSLTRMPIYTLSPLLGNGLGNNKGSLMLEYNCLFMGDGSVPKKQLARLKSEGVVLGSADEDTFSQFDDWPLDGVSCINPLAGENISVAAKYDAGQIIYQWSVDNAAIRPDASFRCNLYFDLEQQQPRLPDQSVECSTQGNIARQVAANGRYSGKMSLTDGLGGHAMVDLPEMVFTQATVQAHIRSVDWGQVVVSHNPQLIPNRDALLRVHVVSDESSISVPELSLLLTLNGQSHAISMVQPNAIPRVVDYENMDASYHVIIPASLMQPGLQAKVTLDNGESLQLAPAFAKTPTFYLTWVPMLVDGKALVPPNISDMQRALRSFWPMGEIQIKQHATFTPVAKSGNELLYELTDLQAAEGDPSYFYGIYSRAIRNDFSGLGWIGRPSAIGIDSDNGSGCDNVGASYLCVMAHELGHNWGLGHVGCGTESGIPDFPYDPSSMGSLGVSYDLTTLYKSSEYVDLMSYCSPQHVSDYSFNHVQDFLEANPPAPFPTTKNAARGSAQGASSGLLLSGSLQDDGAVTVKRVIPLSRPTVVQPASELTVLARSQSQGEVTRYASILTLAEEQPENTPRYFQVELPFTDLSSLTILRDGKVVYRQSVPAAASRKKPAVPQLAEQGAEVCVQWQPGEYEGVSLMHVTDAGQRTVLTMQNPQPSVCLPIEGIPDGGHWLLVTHSGLTARSHQVDR